MAAPAEGQGGSCQEDQAGCTYEDSFHDPLLLLVVDSSFTLDKSNRRASLLGRARIFYKLMILL
jgi:hypothetical protein